VRNGVLLASYALPWYKVKATILNHMFFRTFSLNCQGYYKNDILWQARARVYIVMSNLEL
jgi:hypothetical protein